MVDWTTMMTKLRGLWLVAAFALGLILGTPPAAAEPVTAIPARGPRADPAPAATRGLSDARVRHSVNSDAGVLHICNEPSGSNCGGVQGVRISLPRGTSSLDYGWRDVDGYYLPVRYDAWVDSIFAPPLLYRAAGWRGLGGCGDCTYTIWLVAEGSAAANTPPPNA
jgi:hypothetical protein